MAETSKTQLEEAIKTIAKLENVIFFLYFYLPTTYFTNLYVINIGKNSTRSSPKSKFCCIQEAVWIGS